MDCSNRLQEHTMKPYQGWRYDYSRSRPVTGAWRATRFGVGLCANTEELLLRMIAVKNRESHPSRG